MFNGMMDPEMMRLAQEQMSRISPQELAKIQQQMMSNPELMRMASESMKNLRPEDVRNAAEQLKHTRPEDMVEISEKIANATPEELAAIRARAEAQASYELNAAQMLKKQGNELHSLGKFHDASQKYFLAKKNLKGIPISKCKTLQLQCSLNLMSCYLKTRQFEDCIKEGSEVLAYDLENIKALYRRGQAYKELGNLKAAISDLSKAHELSPEDETIADVLRDANDLFLKEGGQNVSRRLVIEEIVEEDTRPLPSAVHGSSSAEYSVSPAPKAGEYSQSGGASDTRSIAADDECLQGLNGNPETARLFQNYVSNTNPESLAALSSGGLSSEMVKTATDMISKMKPEELQKMLEVASSLNGKGPMFPVPTADNNGNGSRLGSQFPEMTPEMVKMASERLSTMSHQEIQKMVDVASSLKINGSLPMDTAVNGTQRSNSGSQASAAGRIPSTEDFGMAESSSGGLLSNSTMNPSSVSLPTSTAGLQENMRNTMRDPAMRQMFTSMMKNMSPEMMASMSEQFGVKLSREDAAKAQQAMSSLSPADLDRMMRWAEVAQNGVATVKKTKNWLLGRPGMILAICMLILAFILHKLGFIGS